MGWQRRRDPGSKSQSRLANGHLDGDAIVLDRYVPGLTWIQPLRRERSRGRSVLP